MLEEQAEAHPGWRSEREREHVLAQFREAKAIYEKFAEEAGTTGVISEAVDRP